MFFTRFAINPARRGARLLLASPHRMHAAVMAAFPPAATESGHAGRVLWRVDRVGHGAELFIVSPAEPDLTHLVEQAGWPTTSTWQSTEYDRFLSRLTAGQRWAFRLTANPVHHVRCSPGTRSKPLAHVTADQQFAWLVDRADRLGVTFGETPEEMARLVTLTRREVLRFSKGPETSRHRVTLGVATFDGALTVRDADRLRGVLVNGIGRARGYGCGLMTLARLP